MGKNPVSIENPPAVHINDDTGVPPRLVAATIAVGSVLIAVGCSVFLWGNKSPTYAVLLTCVGLAMILAAVGSRAAGSWRSWSATGAGALAILLFLIYVWVDPQPPDFRKHGHISTDLSKVAELRIVDVNPLYTYRDPTTRSIQFVILNKQFKTAQVSIQVDTIDKGPGVEFFEMSGDGNHIFKKYLADDSGKAIRWKLDLIDQTIKDGAEIMFSVPKLNHNNIANQPKNTSSIKILDAIVGKAIAQDAQRPIGQLLDDLKSDNVSVRRNARDDIVVSGPQAVDALMVAFRENPKDYRISLGVTFGLNNMLRTNPNASDEIAKRLTEGDFKQLVEAATNKDKTLQNQATQFLYNLKDKRVATPLLQKVSDDRRDDTLNNSMLIFTSIAPQLAPDEKKVLFDKYSANVPAPFKGALSPQ